jgi:CubicO group peptidase (beta-lactamase class C family)
LFSGRILTCAGLLFVLNRAALPQNADPAQQIDRFLRRAATIHQFNGSALIAEGDRIIYEKAFGEANIEWHIPNTVDTRFEIASMTKPMTAIAIMQLVQEGKVRLDAPISEYLSFYPRATGDRITVDQLLTHTSGLQQDIAFADDPNNVPAVVPMVNSDLLSNDSLVKLIAQRPLRFAPGSSYGYSSDGYAVLGAIIEHVTRTPYWQALKTRVLDPAGMTETGVSLLRPIVPKRASGYAQTFAGYENAPHIGVSPAGGLYSTLRDLRNFDRALYTTTLVSDDSKSRLFATRSVITAYGWKTSEERRPNGGTRKILRTTGGLPGFANLLVRIPAEGRVIILLSNTRDLVWRLDDFAVAINRILDREPYSMPKQSAAEALGEQLNNGARGSTIIANFKRMDRDTANYSVDEAELNRLGYYALYTLRAPADAIEIFAANATRFPQSANVYDSLGEAYLASADTTRAIVNYRKSLSLDPKNTNAATILKRLGVQ